MWYSVRTFCFFFVYNSNATAGDPSWNASTYDRLDAKIAGEQNPFNIQTWNGDLSAFKNKGGKVCKSL